MSGESWVTERAEAALKTNSEAYRLAQEALDMRARAEAAEAEVARLREALEQAAGRLGYLSTALSIIGAVDNAKGAWEWSEQTRAALTPSEQPS